MGILGGGPRGFSVAFFEGCGVDIVTFNITVCLGSG